MSMPSASYNPARAGRGAAMAASTYEQAAIRKLFEEERRIEESHKLLRQARVDKILFHFRRGMSIAGLEARWGRDAVAEAMEALEAGEKRATKAVKDEAA